MNKKVKQRALEIFASLGFKTKKERDSMTNKDWAKFNAAYTEKYGTNFQDDLDEPEESPEVPAVEAEDGSQGSSNADEPGIPLEMRPRILAALSDVAEVTGATVPPTEPKNANEALQAFTAATETLVEFNRRMAETAEPSDPAATIKGGGSHIIPQVMGHSAHTPNHLFGIESNHFKRGSWWNELVITGKGLDTYRDEDAISFRAAFNTYTADFKERCGQLFENNQVNLLDYSKMVKGESFVDYSQMNNKLGEYVVRRMDMIIAYLRTLKSVSGIFPLVSNVQNKTTAPTAFFEELSQSYKSGSVFKGAVNFDGETYHVDDVMFKFVFDDPKQLEKEYIGYMNREGSNPMKWTLFEWCIVHFGTMLFNEEQRRRVIGVKIPRQGDFPQPAMRAADGALRAIQRVEEELKVLPFFDFRAYDRSTMVEYTEEFYEEVLAILPNITGYRVHANEKHRSWYLKGFREKYGRDTDFRGPRENIADLSPDNIIWVPNMDMNDFKMWITRPGNVENYENKPNEMYALYFQQNLEQLIMASWWKGGSGVLAPGVQFSTLKDLENSRRKMQWLFTNYPVITLDADEDEIDGLAGFEIETSENTVDTEITDIINPSIERVYKIICGSLTKATTIKKTGKFAGITADWTPTAVGDYIKVYAELKQETHTISGKPRTVVIPTGNFLELERRVS